MSNAEYGSYQPPTLSSDSMPNVPSPPSLMSGGGGGGSGGSRSSSDYQAVSRESLSDGSADDPVTPA